MNQIQSPVVERDLGDGVSRRFVLLSDELRQIKRECGRGFYSLYSNFSQDAEPDEVANILRLALIGGGTPPVEALSLVNYYARPPRPLKEAYLLAYEVLASCWAGVELKSAEDNSSKQITNEDVDQFFDRIEAQLVYAGGDAGVIRNKTFAEVQQMVKISSGLGKENSGSSGAPDADTFNAIKMQAKK